MREKSGILLQILFAYLNPLLVILKTEPDTLTIVNTAKLVCTKAFFFYVFCPTFICGLIIMLYRIQN